MGPGQNARDSGRVRYREVQQTHRSAGSMLSAMTAWGHSQRAADNRWTMPTES